MDRPMPDAKRLSGGTGKAYHARWGQIALLLLVAILARARTFGNPVIFSDEEFYLYVAHRMWHGALPYVDIWDRKPVGLFLLYMPAAVFSAQASVYAYQAVALAAVTATATLIAVAARRLGWERGAVVAAILYILFLDLADGQGGQSPVFYNLFMIGAVLSTIGARGYRRRRFGMFAMALVGIALQIKYSVVFEGIWIGLWLMWDEYRTTRSPVQAVGFGVILAGIGLLPTAVALIWFTALGHGPEFIFANFESIFLRHPDPVAMQIDNAETALMLLGPLVLLGLAGLGVTSSIRDMRGARLFVYGWLAVALLEFMAFGGWYNHYTLPVMLPASLSTARFFCFRLAKRWLALPAMILTAVAGQTVLASELLHRGTPAQFARIVEVIGPGPGSLYTDMLHPALHLFTGRQPLTRYMFPSHLQIAREAGALGVDQAAELDRIFAQKPQVVTIEGPDSGAAPARMAQVRSLLAQGGYARPIRLPLGTEWVDIYRRDDGRRLPMAKTR